MTTVPALPSAPPPDLAALAGLWQRAEEQVAASRAPSTRAAYASDWRQVEAWCRSAGLPADLPIPPEVLALYLADQSRVLHTATLSRRLSAIKYQHHQLGQASPTDHPQIRGQLAGIRRQRRDDTRQARPLYLEDLAAALDGMYGSTRRVRDRALLLCGWWAALRRSELVGLNAGDVTDHPKGLVLKLRRSKTDQEGKGRQVPLHCRQDRGLDPVLALREWQQLAGIKSGPLFRQVDRWGNVRSSRLTGRAVSDVVKEAAVRLGLDPAGYSSHSLRAGFVSECDRRGIRSSAVRLVTGHRTEAMLATYTRPRALFDSSAGAFFDV